MKKSDIYNKREKKLQVHDDNVRIKKGFAEPVLDKDGLAKLDKNNMPIFKRKKEVIDNRIEIRAEVDIDIYSHKKEWIEEKVLDGRNEDGSPRFITIIKKVPSDKKELIRHIDEGELITKRRRKQKRFILS